MAAQLVERKAELAAIDEVLAAAAGGAGLPLIFEGPAGIGKTALLATAQDHARGAGLRVLAARGGELEGAFPYGVARQLFEPALIDAGQSGRERLLEGPAALAAPAVLGAATEAPSPIAKFAVVHGLYWLVANLAASGPIAIVVDDAHWADAPTLRWLVYLARRLDGLGATLIVSLRSGEPGVDPTARAELPDLPGARVLAPTPLSERGVAMVLESDFSRPPAAELVRACATATGGNPFFVHALAATLLANRIEPGAEASELVGDTGPPAIARAILTRLGHTSEAAAGIARAIAVLEGDANLRRAGALAGLGEDEALRALDALVATGLVSSPAPLAFTHPIVRAAIYGELHPGDRSIAHRRAAEMLAAEGAPIDAVATHALRTEPTGSDATIATLRAAAAHALGIGAAGSAAAYLDRALAEGCDPETRTTMLFDLAIAQKQAGLPDALGSLEEAQRLASSPRIRARALIEQCDFHLYSGRSEEAAGVLDLALAELDGSEPQMALRARTVRALMSAYDPRLVGNFDRDLPKLLALAESGDPETGPLAHLLAAVLLQRGEDAERIRALIELGWGATALAEPQNTETLAQGMWASSVLEDFERSAELIDAVAGIAAATGSAYHFLLARAQSAMLETRRGNLATATGDLRTVFDRAPELGVPVAALVTLNLCADVLLERPEVADIAAMARSIELGPLREMTTGAMFGMVRARLDHAAGESEAAIAELRRIGAIAEALHFEHPGCGLAWRSTLAAMLGPTDRDEALALVAAELATARRVGSVTAVGVALRTEGVLRGGEAGEELLGEAARVLASSPARLEHARALVDLGAARRRAGSRAAAREPLREGLDLADRCGAVPLAERARTELAATGARPRRVRLSGLESLTPSELRVARMAAAGGTSRKIAQELFVTTKTVDAHLGHVYTKLGISSRLALGEALATAEAP
ncbi:MAG TPA: AAA family ATPase [Solirubrobacterales bacterium]|jgi:DNA-binding CsgD family transcriptional regulator|nr:AAA family ATPase [Solirubrobacterales bacterium]